MGNQDRRMEKPVHTAIRLIGYEMNVAHGMSINDQAKYHIDNLCHRLNNAANLKWSELGIWIRANPKADTKEILFMRDILERGDSIRGKRWIDFVAVKDY